MDRFNDLTLFVQVAQVLSFSEAARQLGMSPSGVSRAVQRLEERLGTRLLQRTTRSLSLTPDGRVYFERGLQILSDLEEVELELTQTQSTPKGILRVDLSTALGRIHIAPALARFVADYPELQVKVSLSDRLIDLNDEGIDVSVRLGSSPDSRLIAYPLARAPFVVCAAPGYLERYGQPQSPADLTDHNCINFIYPQSGRPFEWVFQQADDGFKVAVTGNLAFDSTEAVLESAIAGAGIAQLHNYIAGPAIQAGQLQPLLEGYRADGKLITLVYPQKRHLSAKVRVFIEFMKILVAELRLHRMVA
ncbi:MAG: LysR family transcriptional regulator [Cyanobacteria bacterium P01_H01_bin.119]